MRAASVLWKALALATLLVVASCIPARVKELNALGARAVAARRYDQAITYLSESLAIYPDQPKVALQLESAKTMLKQVYVFKIYDLVDGPAQPIETYSNVWKISAELPKLNVAPARVASIRVDLNNHFTKVEGRLRSSTEPHLYYLHLAQMNRLVASPPVDRARGHVATLLEQQHLQAQKQADAAKLEGLALLHTAAAATFAPGDTGLWAESTRRQEALRQRLGIRVALEAQGGPGGAGAAFLLGGVKRRLPRIFLVTDGAPLRLSLRANRPETNQRQVGDRPSAQCQVGTRQERNPECDTLKNRAEMAKRSYEQRLAALETARNRCASATQASSCSSYLSSASSDVSSAQRHYEDLERQVGRCRPTVDVPVYKTFFYQRFTLSRSASATGTVTVLHNGKVWRSRNIVGQAAATDTYGEGLSCARIPPDPLSIPELSALRVQAEERMLDNSLNELYQMRRQLAQRQLAGGDSKEQRLDALVRARLVDESYKQVAQQLSQHLVGQWSADFDLPRRIVQ